MQNYKINYGDAVINDGLFLRRQDKPPAAKISYIDGQGGFFHHLSTFPDRSTIKEEIIELLKTAKRNVFFANFLIQDDEITHNLIQAAERLHGHVYVLTTLKEQDFNSVFESEAKEDGDGGSFLEHFDHIRQLTSKGISVRARKDCHAKFMTVDDKYALVTSANAATTCYGDTTHKNGKIRHANSENGVLLTLPSEVGRLANFFRGIWRSGYNYYVSPDSKTFEVGERTKDIISCSCKEPLQLAEEGQILWTAPDDLRILSALTGMIDRAERKIRISSWVIKGISNHVLGETLKAAAKGGVEINILVRGISRSDHRQSCYWLKKTLGDQVTILGDYKNHSKAVVVDKAEAMVMTANLDAQHGLDSGVEIAFSSRETAFVKAVSAFLDKLEKDAELEFIIDPTQSQAAERAWVWGKSVPWKDIHMHIGRKCRIMPRQLQKLVDALKTQLVKVANDGKDGKGLMHLISNDLIVDCIANDAGRLTVLNVKDDSWAASRAKFDCFLPRSTITITAD
jgi:hypothetical protein